ncbi:MAG: iron uptake transporter permease EfeU, partial [Micrococcales bacterium]
IIGFREGLEAALIVGILAAYLVKLGRRNEFPKLWVGVSSAVAVSVLLGVILGVLVENVPEGTNELIAGLTSIIAVIFVTWMIFWMAKQSRALSKELRDQVDHAEKSAWAMAGIAFLAVIREGIETSVFLWSSSRAAGADTLPLVGAVIGFAAAAVLGYAIYRGAVKLNLSKFFGYTGAFLIIVAAGILSYGIHELQEIGLLPFLTAQTYDISGAIPEGSVLDTFLRGTISFRSAPSQLESLFWFAYLIPTAVLFYRGNKAK